MGFAEDFVRARQAEMAREQRRRRVFEARRAYAEAGNSALPKKSLTGKVLLDFDDWEITVGEALLAVLIAGAMTAAGFLVDSQIKKHVYDSQLRYRQAAEVASPEQFAWALDTDVGDAFAEGTVEAADPVSHKKLGGEWTSVFADYQKHRMHTRVETYTTYDSKGRPHTHTRTVRYWSWDTYRTKKKDAKRLVFLGKEFAAGKFDLTSVRRKYKTVDDGWRKRIEFTAVPRKATGAAFLTAKGGTIEGKTDFREGQSVAKLREEYVESYASAIFWTIWIIFTCGAVVAFAVARNRWLD